MHVSFSTRIPTCSPSLGCKTLVGNHRGQTFLVVGHQVCTHLRRDFVPLLFADPLQVIKVLRLTFGNSNLQLPPQIFYGIKVWRLARSLQDLSVLLLEPFLCCLGRVFWVIVILEYLSMTHFQCPGLPLTVHGPVHRPFDGVQLSSPLSRKTPPKHNVSTSMFDGGDGVLGVIGNIPPPPNTMSWVDAKELPLRECSYYQLLTCIKHIWEPEILLIDRGSKTYLTNWNANQFCFNIFFWIFLLLFCPSLFK